MLALVKGNRGLYRCTVITVLIINLQTPVQPWNNVGELVFVDMAVVCCWLAKAGQQRLANKGWPAKAGQQMLARKGDCRTEYYYQNFIQYGKYFSQFCEISTQLASVNNYIRTHQRSDIISKFYAKSKVFANARQNPDRRIALPGCWIKMTDTATCSAP